MRAARGIARNVGFVTRRASIRRSLIVRRDLLAARKARFENASGFGARAFGSHLHWDGRGHRRDRPSASASVSFDGRHAVERGRAGAGIRGHADKRDHRHRRQNRNCPGDKPMRFGAEFFLHLAFGKRSDQAAREMSADREAKSLRDEKIDRAAGQKRRAPREAWDVLNISPKPAPRLSRKNVTAVAMTPPMIASPRKTGSRCSRRPVRR